MKKIKEVIKSVIKKLAILIILSVSIFGLCTTIEERTTFASAGHSVSHSSGGHSSSHSSSSSRSHRSSRSSSSGSIEDAGPAPIIITIIFMTIFIIIFCKAIQKSKQTTPKNNIVDENEIEAEIKKYIPDFNKAEFLKQGFKTYCDVQNAWMNFRIQDVQDRITDELLNMYQSQLDAMEVKDEQNIIKDITLHGSRLKSVSCQNGVVTIKTGYTIDLYDYIINKSTGKVTSGTSNKKIRIFSEMCFRLTIDEAANLDKCPNCGAKLPNFNGAGRCEYCGSKVVAENKKWVLTSERVESQYFI
ncbi:MAG: TIM44-like domain-containing protein [Clostridia bacterium]|nr:TIM44-like domain-containing protein [Clostridia bacterium]